MHLRELNSTSRGAAPHADHFLCAAKESDPRNAAPVSRPSGTLDQMQASGAAQLDLAGRTPRAPLRDSNSARLNLRSLATDRGGAQGMKSEKTKPEKIGGQLVAHHSEVDRLNNSTSVH